MENTSEIKQKISKEDKKLLKKQNKARHTLLRHEGIKSVSYATQNLVIANGGLGNGMNRQQLREILEVFGLVEALLMPPNKPYSLVKYGTVEEAKKAYSLLSGKKIMLDDLNQSITLYINFVEKVHWEDTLPPTLPPGLLVIEEFVSSEDEKMLLENIDWTTDKQNALTSLKHRRVKHYGYEFRYDDNNVDKENPLPGGLPEICNTVLEKCLNQGFAKSKPDQLTINQYEPGQGIPPHVDTHSAFEDEIISLSLGAETVMDFKHPDGRTVAVMLPRCSLLVMTGESRYLWTHGITPRKFDVVQATERQKVGTVSSDTGNLTLNKRGTRTSFTFRKVRRTPCNCAYPSVCDSQQSNSAPSAPDSDREALRLEQEHVHKVYEKIAGHFSSTRHTPWPKIVEFLLTLPEGSLVADIGCGNGKYLGVSKDLYMIGCDRSKTLVDICAEKKFEAFICDALSVPVRSDGFDACISIAVIHHFSTEERRMATLSELARLLRPGGKALIYVWAMEQEFNKQKSKYLKDYRNSRGQREKIKAGLTQEQFNDQMLDCSSHTAAYSEQAMSNLKDKQCNECQIITPRLPVHTNRTLFNSQDVLVPWHLKSGAKVIGGPAGTMKSSEGPVRQSESSLVFHRYYHVFCEGELEAACKKMSNIKIQQSYHDQGNWCVILEKL
ncbi:alkylated DNA repair protein alkB homolog 8 [Rhinatrema bivittatum]|uniref:alkylated DNA repair protein alkB homolog 8 n=1 Tax=Rhinatrema bivittatum TaxID=194408 RepID=UPI00112D69B7|nr:alkylated DNA repair protein alkB homolog 8 [Rhinatrema bivittatum]